jgi:hypothetical protein
MKEIKVSEVVGSIAHVSVGQETYNDWPTGDHLFSAEGTIACWVDSTRDSLQYADDDYPGIKDVRAVLDELIEKNITLAVIHP